MTRPLEEYEQARALLAQGLNDCEVARRMGIPRSTIRDWRYGKRTGDGALRGQLRPQDCPLCLGDVPPERPYAYLLGLYLGDGCISDVRKKTFRLRIALDLRYPGIIDECKHAITDVRPSAPMKVGEVEKVGCVEVGAYWKHWPCLFPQHGPGPKHLRKIELAQWQLAIARRHPDLLLRGLIHSDGYRGLNFVNGTGYPRYQFTNNSADIRKIFCDACDDYGVRWRQMNWKTISVARRADVAKLDLIIGPKR